MKLFALLIPLTIACVEPPSTDKAAGLQPDGAAAPGAPEPSEASAGEGEGSPAQTPATPAPGAGPGAIVQEPGPDGPENPAEMELTQDQITDGTEISGTLSCEDCTGALLVRVEDGGSHPPSLLTAKSYKKAGKYSILVPKDKKVVLMVVHDANDDGHPTPGEEIGIWTGGLLSTATASKDVDLTVGVMPDEPPVPPSEEAPEE